jgi:hypothetical protein
MMTGHFSATSQPLYPESLQDSAESYPLLSAEASPFLMSDRKNLCR